MSGVTFVYTLFGSAETARRVARQLVEERLAACANMLPPCASIYQWKGTLREDAEIPVVFKTAAEGRDALMARLAELHDYDVPAILAFPAEAAHPPFAQWIAGQVAL